ncbi:MAG: hypothetical protein WD055_00690 [Candidatus Dependentiae bacterium]
MFYLLFFFFFYSELTAADPASADNELNRLSIATSLMESGPWLTRNKERFIGGMHYLGIVTVLQQKIGTSLNMREHVDLLGRICGYYQGVGWDSIAQEELYEKLREVDVHAKMMRQYEDRYDALIARPVLQMSEKRHLHIAEDPRADKRVRGNPVDVLPNKYTNEDEVIAMVTTPD